jgi:transcriptional regulator with XRE-family HTH domain
MSYPAGSHIHRIFSANLTRLRVARRITQKKMAIDLGMNYKDYCLVERGASEITLTLAAQIAAVIGVRANELFDPAALHDTSEQTPIQLLLPDLERLDEQGLHIIITLTREFLMRQRHDSNAFPILDQACSG